MRKLYICMALVSALLASADSADFRAWLIWEAVWIPVFLFSVVKLVEEGEKNDGLQ